MEFIAFTDKLNMKTLEPTQIKYIIFSVLLSALVTACGQIADDALLQNSTPSTPIDNAKTSPGYAAVGGGGISKGGTIMLSGSVGDVADPGVRTNAPLRNISGLHGSIAQ